MTRRLGEPARGLPALLPPGERVLWQGSPEWRSLARRAFLGGPVAIYFAALILWTFGRVVLTDMSLGQALPYAVWYAVVGAAGLGLIGLLGWLMARSTVYTITNRRVVIRTGVALTVTVNVPFKKVVAANLKTRGGGLGDIALVCSGRERFSYVVLWPNVRPWGINRPEPALRCVPQAKEVAAVLSEALGAYETAYGIDGEMPPLTDLQPAAVLPTPDPRAPRNKIRPTAGVVPAE